jgi:biopolymer transport protein ExbD/biopolymer transport protein TolR
MKKNIYGQKKVISDLNLTNLIDVVFALLIIFMITAPMMTQGVEVNLPEAESKNFEVKKSIQVTINAQKEVYIDQQKVPADGFRTFFHKTAAGITQVPVFVNADENAPYGIVIRVIADIQKEGVKKLSFLTVDHSTEN